MTLLKKKTKLTFRSDPYPYPLTFFPKLPPYDINYTKHM